MYAAGDKQLERCHILPLLVLDGLQATAELQVTRYISNVLLLHNLALKFSAHHGWTRGKKSQAALQRLSKLYR